MEQYIIQEDNFRAEVMLNLQDRRRYYRYSLWRTSSGEHLFDGAAGDATEALDTVRACMRYLQLQGGTVGQ